MSIDIFLYHLNVHFKNQNNKCLSSSPFTTLVFSHSFIYSTSIYLISFCQALTLVTRQTEIKKTILVPTEFTFWLVKLSKDDTLQNKHEVFFFFIFNFQKLLRKVSHLLCLYIICLHLSPSHNIVFCKSRLNKFT